MIVMRQLDLGISVKSVFLTCQHLPGSQLYPAHMTWRMNSKARALVTHKKKKLF